MRLVVEKVGPKTGKDRQTDSDGYREREKETVRHVYILHNLQTQVPSPPQISGTLFFFKLPCLRH